MSDGFDQIIECLRAGGFGFARGLSDGEVERVQEQFGFVFPPDLRQFLQHALPISQPMQPGQSWRVPFPDWRNEAAESLRQRLAMPLDGILFDVQKNGFWREYWGERPNDIKDALAVAREAVRAAPILIPVYGHRFLPALPCEAGNPVFSVMQTDIIIYGYDLVSYLAIEFEIENIIGNPEEPRRIDFWSWFTDEPEEPLTLELVEAKIEACQRSIEFWKRMQREQKVDASRPDMVERAARANASRLQRDEQALREWEEKRRDLA